MAVFDFFNVLTTNGGNQKTHDLGKETGNHHRWWNNTVRHVVETDGGPHDTTAYATSAGDDHPVSAGNRKATVEFIPLLNFAYNRWQGG